MRQRRQQRMSLSHREELRTIQPLQTGFTRAFSVERPVLFEDGEAERLEHKIKRTFKAELPRSDVKAFTIIPPKDWCVKLNQQSQLVEDLRQHNIKLSKQEVFKKVASLSGDMRRTITEQSNYYDPIAVGHAGTFDSGGIKRDIGFELKGWKKARGGVEIDEAGLPTALMPLTPAVGIVAAEHVVCQQAVSALFMPNRSGEDDDKTLVDGTWLYVPREHTPYVAVTHNKRGVLDEQYHRIAPILEELMPQLILGDTIIKTRGERTDEKPFQAIATPISAQLMLRHAA